MSALLAKLGVGRSVMFVGLRVGGPASVTDSTIEDSVPLDKCMRGSEGVEPAPLMNLFSIVDRGSKVLEDGEGCECTAEGLP